MSNNMDFDTKQWGKFKISKLFKCERGKRLTKENRIDGSIPFATAGYQNQGITDFIDSEGLQTYKDVLTIDMFCNCFYRQYNFACDDNILILKPNFIYNKFTLLFISTIIECNKNRYFYGRQYRQKDFENHIIKLPISLTGEPDWQYMENYIKKIYKPLKKQIETKNEYKKMDFDTKQWGKFKIGDLFKVLGTQTTKIDDLEEYGIGNFPYITTSSNNNGELAKYNYYTEVGNVLVIDSAVTGFCSYQQFNFSASDHVEKLIPKFEKFNKYIGLYISTIINQNNYRYNYGRKFNQKRIKETIIKLPITSTGEPDWQYMENYIRSLQYGDLI